MKQPFNDIPTFNEEESNRKAKVCCIVILSVYVVTLALYALLLYY